MNLKDKYSQKSKQYTSAEGYRDMDGNHRQFTFIDHDVKTRKSMGNPLKKEELEELKNEITRAKERKIQEILALPAINAIRHPNGEIYENFIIRNQEDNIITWNEDVVRGACMIDSNIGSNLWNILWKTTVKEASWWDDMSHEDIIAGKWKQLI